MMFGGQFFCGLKILCGKRVSKHHEKFISLVQILLVRPLVEIHPTKWQQASIE